MQVKVRTFAACALLVLLLVPVAAGAGKAEVKGPLTLSGQGFFGGELRMELGEGQRPVRIAGRAGYVGFLDLGGDLRVRCLGRGRVAKQETEQGIVYLCKGRAGHAVAQAVALGSHFRFRGFAKRFAIHLPEGAAGTLSGQFRRAGDESRERSAGRGEAERGERREQKEQKGPIPTVAQLAAMLAAATAG